MSLLFENLQALTNFQKLEERKILNVSEYNKLKVALNKHNTMKANFILHPGEIEEYDYKLKIKIYGAFRSFEQTRQSFHAYRDNISNDQASRDGVGVRLYDVYINLIDESIKFSDSFNNWGLDSYLKKYEKQLIDNQSISTGDMNLESIKATIDKVINQSKIDLEQALASKNFIYNLTGKAKTEPSDSKKYNLDLDVENITLTEDFDSSMPNWLMRAIKKHNASRNIDGHKDINYNMPLDTLKWEVKPFPEKGKLDNIGNNEYIALLIDKSGDEHQGNYIIYFPAANIGNYETITINGRNRSISSMSLRALAPYVKEYAHTVDRVADIQDLRQKQQDRATSQQGLIDRKSNEYDFWSRDIRDKSGYIVDPNKYKRLLAQNKQDKYADRLNDLYVVLMDVKSNLSSYMSNDDTIPSPGKRDYGKDNKFNKGSRAYKEYSAALSEYSSALEYLDNIKAGEKDRWGESFEQFEKAIRAAEMRMVNCLNILEDK